MLPGYFKGRVKLYPLEWLIFLGSEMGDLEGKQRLIQISKEGVPQGVSLGGLGGKFTEF